MPDLVHFLRSVGKATVTNGARALARMVPFGETAFEITRDVLDDYRRAPAVVAPTDGKTAVPVPEIRGPERAYALVRFLAAGDVADVYLTRPASDPTPAEIPFILKATRHSAGNAVLHNEARVLRDLLVAAGDTTYRNYLPGPVESFTADDGARVNVLVHEPGLYTLEQVHEQHPALDGRHLAWIFNRLLTVLGFCHGRGIVHGAVLPAHVLIHAGDHGLRLVGWGQSAKCGQRLPAMSQRYRDWYPAEVQKQRPISPATDLFLAAKCMIYLAGGDPVRDRMPDAVPAELRRFFAACLLEGAAMRPNDAWQLMDEFNELLHRRYGPPTFHELTLS